VGGVCKAKKTCASRFVRPYYKVEEMGKRSITIIFIGRLVPNNPDAIVIPFLFVNGDVAPKPTTSGRSLAKIIEQRVIKNRVQYIHCR
jgi:hypothetical protein